MKLAEIFNRKVAAVFLVLLGALLAISPAGLRKASNFSNREIASSIASKSDHVTAEDVAAWVIDKRPDIILVDIRSTEEFTEYHIPGSINIPLAKLFDQESQDILRSDYTFILYSNGGTHAAQAWVMLKQMGIDSYVMLGGLNYWVSAILNPEPPDDLVADPEVLDYQFRKSASEFFNKGGVSAEQNENSEQKPVAPPKIKFKRKKQAEEGC